MCEGHIRATKVPVEFDGFKVGSGFVSSNGDVVIFRLNDSPVAQEMRERLKAEDLSKISINPRNTKL